jgi:hypothetical protein
MNNQQRPKLILHIGQHKTGSKALQSFLAYNAVRLSQHGILYPVEKEDRHDVHAYKISHFRFFILLRAEALKALGQREMAAQLMEEQEAFCYPLKSIRQAFEALENERSLCGATSIILSAEDLFDMHTAHEEGFCSELVECATRILAELTAQFNYDPIVVVYLRRQDELLGAHYIQFIKGSAVNDVDFNTFAEAFAPRLQSLKILSLWALAFGEVNIQVYPYERNAMPSGIVHQFFEQVLGISVPENWPQQPRDAESVNASPDRDYVELIHCLNRLKNRGLSVIPRELVLKAALKTEAEKENQKGIAAWLSPKDRREFLTNYDSMNTEIAKRFKAQSEAPFFSEPLPSNDHNWREYSGLSLERVLIIAQHIIQDHAQEIEHNDSNLREELAKITTESNRRGAERDRLKIKLVEAHDREIKLQKRLVSLEKRPKQNWIQKLLAYWWR